MKFDCSYISEKGARAENQDQYGQFIRPDGESACFIVADGLGGHSGGQVAASITIGTVLEEFTRADLSDVPLFLANALTKANSAICAEQAKDPNKSNMRSTCAVLVVHRGAAWWAHVGDTRIYHFVGDVLVDCTKDHSVVQMMVDMGEISPEEMRGHADRNRIIKSLGNPDACAPTVHTEGVPVSNQTAFVLCTDGFWEHILDDELGRILARSRNAAAAMKTCEDRIQAKLTADSDNYTGQIVCFPDAPKPTRIPKKRKAVQRRANAAPLNTKAVLAGAAALIVLVLVAASVVMDLRWQQGRTDQAQLADAVKGLEETRGPLTPEDLTRYAPVKYAEARRLEDAAERLQATNPQQAATRLDEARQEYERAAKTAGRRREEHAQLESDLNRAKAQASERLEDAFDQHEYLEAFALDAWPEAYARWEAAEAALDAWHEEEDALDPSAWAALWDDGARVAGITKLYRQAATALENVFLVAGREQQERIARRLAAAREELEANALDRAYAKFDEVLQMEDNHAEALQGIRDVHRLRLAAIQTAIDASDFDRADQLITATRTMRNANTGDLNHLQQWLGDARQADAAQRERERLAREMEDARIQVTEARNAAHAEGAADPTCPFWAQGESRRNKAEQHAAEDRGIALARDEFRAAIPFYEAAKAGARAYAVRARALDVVDPNESALRDLMTHAVDEFQAGDDSSADPSEAKAHYDAAATAYQQAIDEHDRILRDHELLQEEVQEAANSAREWVNKVPSDDGSAARDKMREANAHRVAGRLAEARDAYNEAKGLCIPWVLRKRRQTAADLHNEAVSAPADITLEEAQRDFREAETAITRDPEGAILLYDRAIEKFNLVLDALPQAQEETHGLLSPLQPQAPQPQEREDTYDLESPPAGSTQPAPTYRRRGGPIQPNLYRGDN